MLVILLLDCSSPWIYKTYNILFKVTNIPSEQCEGYDNLTSFRIGTMAAVAKYKKVACENVYSRFLNKALTFCRRRER